VLTVGRLLANVAVLAAVIAALVAAPAGDATAAAEVAHRVATATPPPLPSGEAVRGRAALAAADTPAAGQAGSRAHGWGADAVVVAAAAFGALLGLMMWRRNGGRPAKSHTARVSTLRCCERRRSPDTRRIGKARA